MSESDLPPVHDAPPPLPPEPLAKLPYPIFVRILAFVTLGAFLAGLVRLPRTLSLGMQAARAEKRLAQGRYYEAANGFRNVGIAYPNSNAMRIGYIEACLGGGDLRDAYGMLQIFQGKKMKKSESEKLDRLAADLELKIKALEAAEKR
jgi:hypothetical protein